MIRWPYVALLALGTIAGARADDGPVNALTRRVINNLAHEHVICSAFYSVGAKCFAGDKDPKDRDRMQGAAAEALRRAFEFSTKAGLKAETNIARLKMSFDQMSEKIDNDCGNISLLLVEHAKQCKLLMDEPVKRMEQIMDDLISRDQRSR